MTHRLFITLLMVMLIALYSCKSKTRAPTVVKPPPASPSVGTPTAGLPSSTPSGQQPASSSKPSPADTSTPDAGLPGAGDALRESGKVIANSGARIENQTTTGADAASLPPESPRKGNQGAADALPSGVEPAILSDIKSAQDALETAADALLKAGDAVADAATDEELALAEAQLADARISIIIAEQEIGSLRDSPYYEDAADLAEIEAALEQANVALVVATRAVLSARTGMPDFPTVVPDDTIPASSEVAVLEDALESSLEIFDERMDKARDAVIATTPPPAIPAPATDSDLSEDGIIDHRPHEERESPAIASGQEPVDVALTDVPEDIPSAQGDDIVAQQLREAAMTEANPSLKEKLWAEYKRYKAGL